MPRLHVFQWAMRQFHWPLSLLLTRRQPHGQPHWQKWVSLNKGTKKIVSPRWTVIAPDEEEEHFWPQEGQSQPARQSQGQLRLPTCVRPMKRLHDICRWIFRIGTEQRFVFFLVRCKAPHHVCMYCVAQGTQRHELGYGNGFRQLLESILQVLFSLLHLCAVQQDAMGHHDFINPALM